MCVWTEASAGLQRILQEIQPRDTNDFFTSARELDTHPGDDDTQTRTTHTPSLNTGEGCFLLVDSTGESLQRGAVLVVS